MGWVQSSPGWHPLCSLPPFELGTAAVPRLGKGGAPGHLGKGGAPGHPGPFGELWGSLWGAVQGEEQLLVGLGCRALAQLGLAAPRWRQR